jgi:predicted ribosomally synthesized peptide with nif11-like leader
MSSKAESAQAATRLLTRLSTDKALLAKVDAAKSYEDFKSIAKQNGYDLSGLSEKEAYGLTRGDTSALGEIGDEELAKVAGGYDLTAVASVALYKPPAGGSTGGSTGGGYGNYNW